MTPEEQTPTSETDALREEIRNHSYVDGSDFSHMLDHARKMERERNEAREQRDRLATILQNIRSGYGGQIADPTCDCGDCEFLITIDNALQYITKSN